MTEQALALLYARKSSSDERAKSGVDSESVDTQLANGRTRAERDGCEVVGEHKDDARSGGDFTRPGLMACKDEAIRRARSGYRVRIYCADRSRLGRHRTRTAQLIEELIEEGIELWSYHAGLIAGPNTSDEDWLVGAIHDYGSVRARRDASRRTREGLARRVKKGYHAGGDCYGYRRCAINFDGTQTYSHTILVIEPEEAEVVRGIFRAKAAGHGYGAIAKALNGDPALSKVTREFFRGKTPPSPGHLVARHSAKVRKGKPHVAGNPHTWCPTGIRSQLYNERYRGVLVWGKKENYDRGARTRLRRRATTNPEPVDVPELRIIDDELWQKVHRQLKTVHAHYTRHGNGRFWLGRTESGTESRYLLSSLLRCKQCRGSMVAITFKRNGKSVDRYACSMNYKRGATACGNNTRPMMTELNDFLLDHIEQHVLTPDNVRAAAALGAKLDAERRRTRPDEEARLKGEAATLHAELNRYLDLVGSGKAPESVLERIQALELRVKAKEQELAEYAASNVVNLDDAQTARALRDNLARFRELLRSRHTPKVRQVLRKLLGDEVLWIEPKPDGYELTAETRLGPLFNGHGAQERT